MPAEAICLNLGFSTLNGRLPRSLAGMIPALLHSPAMTACSNCSLNTEASDLWMTAEAIDPAKEEIATVAGGYDTRPTTFTSNDRLNFGGRLKIRERLEIHELGIMHGFLPGRGSPGSCDEVIASAKSVMGHFHQPADIIPNSHHFPHSTL